MEDLIKKHTKTGKIEDEWFCMGVKEAMKLAKTSIAENLVVGAVYYIIMYENDDKRFPYIIPMKLFQIKHTATRTTCIFTKNTKKISFDKNTPDLTINSRSRIAERVFYTEEDANAEIRRMKK